MREVIELKKQDIEAVIATQFVVPVKNVEIEIIAECVGYGMGEHMEPVVVAKIIKERNWER